MSEVPTATTVGDLASLVPSWARSLRATNRSPKTLTTYVGAANQLIAFLASRGMPTDAAKVRREHVEALDRKSTRLNSSHIQKSRMPSSA